MNFRRNSHHESTLGTYILYYIISWTADVFKILLS